MAEGYGFGAEGDWKTAVMVRLAKVMATGLPGGTSFMEDYTYDFDVDGPKVLGAHMLEVCPSIAASQPTCEIHPLSIGGRSDPVRLVFTAAPGPALVASLIDLGDRFRIVANEIDVVDPKALLPRLPVARAVWKPRPDFRTAAEAWLLAGGSHHTVLTQPLTREHFEDFAEMAGLEILSIDADTRSRLSEGASLEPGVLPPCRRSVVNGGHGILHAGAQGCLVLPAPPAALQCPMTQFWRPRPPCGAVTVTDARAR